MERNRHIHTVEGIISRAFGEQFGGIYKYFKYLNSNYSVRNPLKYILQDVYTIMFIAVLFAIVNEWSL